VEMRVVPEKGGKDCGSGGRDKGARRKVVRKKKERDLMNAAPTIVKGRKNNSEQDVREQGEFMG